MTKDERACRSSFVLRRYCSVFDMRLIDGFARNAMPLLQINQLARPSGGLAAVGALDLAMDGGELISIIGPNGAGKTTLFNLITGLDVPDSGRIMLEGQ